MELESSPEGGAALTCRTRPFTPSRALALWTLWTLAGPQGPRGLLASPAHARPQRPRGNCSLLRGGNCVPPPTPDLTVGPDLEKGSLQM